MRIASLLGVCVTAAVLTACNDAATPFSATVPPDPGATLVYSVLGTTDAVGFGSSKPCGLLDDCDGNGYAWVAARQLRTQGFTVTLTSLGIPGAVIGPAVQDLAQRAGRPDVVVTLIDAAMPRLRQTASFVTLSAGVNDVNVILSAVQRGLGANNPTAFVDEQVAIVAAEFATLRQGVRENAPGARLVVLNLPNLAGLPYLAGAPLAQKQAVQRAAVGVNAALNSSDDHVRVVDLMCDPRSYVATNYSPDGLHPNDTGHAAIAAAIVAALTSASYPAPRTSCPQMMLY
jgi:lysophospholipase L1-like esterase